MLWYILANANFLQNYIIVNIIWDAKKTEDWLKYSKTMHMLLLFNNNQHLDFDLGLDGRYRTSRSSDSARETIFPYLPESPFKVFFRK